MRNDETAMMRAIKDVMQERIRQVNEEGHTPARDRQTNPRGTLAIAAAAYALNAAEGEVRPSRGFAMMKLSELGRRIWPWKAAWWKPKDRRRNLVRAGALILAEIERLDREADAIMSGGHTGHG